jgi:hypothetical protein
MEIETARTRPLSELTDAELMDLLLDGIEDVVEAILVSRGHTPLTATERQRLKECEHEGGSTRETILLPSPSSGAVVVSSPISEDP